MIYISLVNLMLGSMYLIFPGKLTSTMLPTQMMILSLNPILKASPWEMVAQIGNMTVQQHMLRWHIGIHSTVMILEISSLNINVTSQVEVFQTHPLNVSSF